MPLFKLFGFGGNVSPAGKEVKSAQETPSNPFNDVKIKLVINGARLSGKSCMFHRLRGGSFLETPFSVKSNQKTVISWTYMKNKRTVPIEVTDVVNSVADLYNAASAVILMTDMTKLESATFVKQEIVKIPVHVPILLVNNKRDLVLSSTVDYLNRSNMMAVLTPESTRRQYPLWYCETSMKNGFGLLFIYRFLEIPYLRELHNRILQMMMDNEEECEASISHLERQATSSSGSMLTDYEFYTKALQERAQAKPRLHAPPARPIPGMEKLILVGGNGNMTNPVPHSALDQNNLSHFLYDPEEDTDPGHQQLKSVSTSSNESDEESTGCRRTNPLVMAPNEDIDLSEFVAASPPSARDELALMVEVSPHAGNKKNPAILPDCIISSLEEDDSESSENDQFEDNDNEEELGPDLGLAFSPSSTPREEAANKHDQGQQTPEITSFIPCDGESSSSLEKFLEE